MAGKLSFEGLTEKRSALEAKLQETMASLETVEKGSEDAMKLVKTYQRTLDQLTYVLVSLAQATYLEAAQAEEVSEQANPEAVEAVEEAA